MRDPHNIPHSEKLIQPQRFWSVLCARANQVEEETGHLTNQEVAKYSVEVLKQLWYGTNKQYCIFCYFSSVSIYLLFMQQYKYNT